MNILHRLVPITLSFVLSGCIYLPVVDEKESANCKTVTKNMALDKIDVTGEMSIRCRNEGCAALLAGSLVVSAGSAIISGSIVLTDNTLHWLEYQGTCSDGYLNKVKQSFLESLYHKAEN